jgi:hypothetical protein
MEPLRAPGIPTRHLAVTYGCGSVPDLDRLSLELAVLVLLPEQGDRRET